MNYPDLIPWAKANALAWDKDDDAHGLTNRYWGCDTETTNFDPGETLGKTRTSPFKPGRLVVGSFAGRGLHFVFDQKNTCAFLEALLEHNQHIVFHNASYDVPVLVEYNDRGRPRVLKCCIVRALRANRIHDTKVLEVLTRVAKGTESHLMHKDTHLDNLASRYCGIALTKDNDVRCNFGQYEERPQDIPEHFLHYAAMDAVATVAVYTPLHKKAMRLANRECRGVTNEGALEKYGPLCERNHVMGDVATGWLQSFPIRVDQDIVRDADLRLKVETDRLEGLLMGWKMIMPVKRKRKAGDVIVDVPVPWAKRVTRDGKKVVKTSHKLLRFALHGYALARDIAVERTSTGEVTLERDFWAEVIPRATPETEEAAKTEANLEARLSVWMAYTRLRMMQVRYLDALLLAERHYPRYKSLGARTTRLSASKIPIHQIPKHRDSLRGAFIPEPDRVYIEGDYAAAELTALAQTYHNCYGHSVLGDAINAEQDPHVETAKRLFDTFEDETPERQKELRQASKAVNFGLPGGMFPKTFSAFARGFGVYLTVEEARGLRNKALDADPELARWISTQTPDRVKLAARNLGLTTNSLCECLGTARAGTPNWNLTYSRLRKWAKDPGGSDHTIPTPPGFNAEYDLWKEISVAATGTMRGGCFFTEARNQCFQAEIASVGKLALFNLWAEWEDTDCWAPVTMVHDSFLLQTLDDPDEIKWASELLESCMLYALRECCPDVHGGVDIEPPKAAWGKIGGVFAE